MLILIIVMSSCATLLAPQKHPLDLNSEPHGADVYVNGVNMGATPIRLRLFADKSYAIEFRNEGYESTTRVVSTKLGVGWVVLDIIVGVFPLIIDAVTGAWYNLDQNSVNAVLIEQKQ